jgi:hypothetical protein
MVNARTAAFQIYINICSGGGLCLALVVLPRCSSE